MNDGRTAIALTRGRSRSRLYRQHFKEYNTGMSREDRLPFRGSRILDIAIYLAAIVACALGVRGLPDLTSQALAIGLGITFLLAHRFLFEPAKNERQLSLYFGLQTAIIAGLLLLRSSTSDTFTFLFFLLAIRVPTAFPQRKTFAWVAAFFMIDSSILLWVRGVSFTPVVFFNAAVFFICIVFGSNMREIELARRENASTLEELRAAQRQIQDLAVAEERNRLARDLHDSAKQQAFALSAQLDAIRSLLERDPLAAEKHLRQAEQLADQLRQELATLILELRPSVLGDQNLRGALDRYIEEWSGQSGIETDFRVEQERPLLRETEQTLFRIAQEALANVSRHSQARHAEVSLDYREDKVILTVKDDGRGFDPAQLHAGVGTQSMRERAGTLPDATFTLESAPDKGTVVTVTTGC
jgi:signal transduction histidine kinase